MAVVLNKKLNAAGAVTGHALRGAQQIPCTLLRLLDRPRHAFEAAPCAQNLLGARVASELYRGSLVSIDRQGTNTASPIQTVRVGICDLRHGVNRRRPKGLLNNLSEINP